MSAFLPMVTEMDRPGVTTSLIVKILLVTAAVVGALYFLLFLVFDVVLLLFIAVFFALAISSPVNWLDGRGVPRWIAILLVYLAIGAGIFGIGLLIVPPLVDGVEDLSADLPGYVDDLRENPTFRDYDDRYDITEKLTEQAEELPTQLGDAAGTLRDVTVGVFSRFVQLFSILVITFFLLMDGKRIMDWIYAQLSDRRRERLKGIADDAQSAITGYVFGNVVISDPRRGRHLHHADDPRRAVRGPARDPVRVLRPRPARRRDDRRHPRRDRRRLRRLPDRR